jgi:hypothetical protein
VALAFRRQSRKTRQAVLFTSATASPTPAPGTLLFHVNLTVSWGREGASWAGWAHGNGLVFQMTNILSQITVLPCGRVRLCENILSWG